MEEVLDAIRRVVARWTKTTTHLTDDALAGEDTITVRTTRRFKAGDQLLITAVSDDGRDETENELVIDEVIDKHTIRLTSPLKFHWSVDDDASIIKTIHGNFVRAVHIGEPSVISLNELPAITVSAMNRSSEWYTIRATKERFNIEIAVYVVDDTNESSYRFLLQVIDVIQKGLKKNITPLVNSYDQISLLADASAGDQFIRVSDATIFKDFQHILIENSYDFQETDVLKVCDAHTIQLSQALEYDMPVDDTIVIKPHRLVYNSWPADISYGKIHKGTLLKSGVISYFVEETEIQGEGGIQDTQLK